MNQPTEETCPRFIERRARGWTLDRIAACLRAQLRKQCRHTATPIGPEPETLQPATCNLKPALPMPASFAVPPPNFKFHQPVKFGEICPPRKSVARPPTLGQNQNPSAANPLWPNHLHRCSAAAGAITPPRGAAAPGNSNFTKPGGGGFKHLDSIGQNPSRSLSR